MLRLVLALLCASPAAAATYEYTSAPMDAGLPGAVFSFAIDFDSPPPDGTYTYQKGDVWVYPTSGFSFDMFNLTMTVSGESVSILGGLWNTNNGEDFFMTETGDVWNYFADQIATSSTRGTMVRTDLPTIPIPASALLLIGALGLTYSQSRQNRVPTINAA